MYLCVCVCVCVRVFVCGVWLVWMFINHNTFWMCFEIFILDKATELKFKMCSEATDFSGFDKASERNMQVLNS